METPDHLSFPELRSKFEKFPKFPPSLQGSLESPSVSLVEGPPSQVLAEALDPELVQCPDKLLRGGY